MVKTIRTAKKANRDAKHTGTHTRLLKAQACDHREAVYVARAKMPAVQHESVQLQVSLDIYHLSK